MNNEYYSDLNFQELANNLRNKNIEHNIKKDKAIVSILFLGATQKQFEYGYVLLKDKGLVGNVSVPTAEIGNISSKMNWQNILLLQNQSWSIVSQSRNQICDNKKISEKTNVISEVEGSKSDLTKNKVLTNVYLAPCGIINDTIKSYVLSNYSGLITFGNVNNSKSSGKNYSLTARIITNDNMSNLSSWIDNVNTSKNWIIIAIPEIGEGEGYLISNENLTKAVEYLEKSDLQFVSIDQVIKV
jgi:hypothetical protein